MDLKNYLDIAVNASKKASSILIDYFNHGVEIDTKGPADIVTQADREAELAIKEIILHNFPDHGILGEETGEKKGVSDFIWIIDPLDGTTNFANKLPIFAVSIALYKKDKPLVGVVQNPVSNQIFTAISKEGAYLNNDKIKVSQKSCINDSLIVTGFPYNFKEILDDVSYRFFNVLKNARGVRRLGSASLDLCYVASGIFEGFFEQNLKPWDTAAGYLIAKEAGAVVSDFSYNDYNPYMKEILATNGKIHKSITSLLERL